MNKTKLSIIIPVHNAETVLSETLHCLFAQTFLTAFPGAMEVIAVNDASTDNSLQILYREAEKHPDLLRVISLAQNKGPGGARNAGLAEVSGDYIGFLDSDDTIEPTMYEKLYDAVTADGGYDLADCGIIDDNLESRVFCYTDPAFKGTLDDNVRNLMLSDVGYLWSRLYKRSLLQDPPIRFREGVVSEDLDFLSEVIARAGSVTVVEEPLYRYHNTPDSASKKDAEVEFFETTILAMRGVYDRLSVLPDYDGIRTGAEYTYCRLAAEILRTIDGYMEYQAITPDFAIKLQEILYAELRKLVKFPVNENTIILERMSASDRDRLAAILA